MIRFDAAKLPLVITAAYNLSQPQGMGYLHYAPGPLGDEALEQIIAPSRENLRPIQLDYVKGRAVKLGLYRDAEGWYLIDHGHWFDHSADDWADLKNTISR